MYWVIPYERHVLKFFCCIGICIPDCGKHSSQLLLDSGKKRRTSNSTLIGKTLVTSSFEDWYKITCEDISRRAGSVLLSYEYRKVGHYSLNSQNPCNVRVF